MNIRVKQRDITDCGAACLASIASWYHFNLPVSRIRQLAGTDKMGTNVLGLVEACDKMGFLAKGVRGEWDSLFKIPKPAIGHLIVRNAITHYVVILKTTGKYIEVMDPMDGNIHKVSHDEFRKEWTGVLILIAPGDKFRAGNQKESLSARLWQLIKPNRHVLIQSLAGAIIFSILGLSTSIYVGKLIDNVIPGGNINLLNLLGIAMLTVILIRFLLGIFQSLFILKTGQRIDASLILGYYHHLMKLPQSFFDNMRTGEIISRISDAVKIRVFINEVSVNLILNVFILVASLILMFTFYWKLAFIMVAIIPVYYLIYFVSNKLNKKVQRLVMEKSADLEATLVESLNSASTIKMFNLEEHSNLKTESRFVELLKTLYNSGLNSILSGSSVSIVTQLITVVILWAGAGYSISTQITPGELITFYSIVGYFTGPVSSIIGFNRTLQDARIAADRLFEIFDLETDNDENKIELKREMVKDIRFDSVRFRYGTRVEVFQSLSFNIMKGQITAIVGESGSGKTTIASLLHNLYPLQEGHVYIGEFNLKHFTNSSIRRIISVVPQRIDLFSGTVTDNIAAGDYYPDMTKIITICNKLGMTEFIESLPEGFRSYIGENGSLLSGGQKQRIAIARALYRDPEILVLDEATSSLDTIAESFVQNAIKVLREEKKTVIVIAHRLSTISMADRIIVIDKGTVLQTGTLNELSTNEGKFRRMWLHQTIETKNQNT